MIFIVGGNPVQMERVSRQYKDDPNTESVSFVDGDNKAFADIVKENVKREGHYNMCLQVNGIPVRSDHILAVDDIATVIFTPKGAEPMAV